MRGRGFAIFTLMNPYDPKVIEKKWQDEWERSGIYNAADNDSSRKKFYALIEFPYPSGAGLHTGHIRSNTAMDILARKRRMEGQNVLYPIGWDAFGLPTENYAIKTGTHPREVTKQNTDTFRRQLKSLGFSFDWSREIDTTNPAYYKWTQWIFLQMFKGGLAYKAKMPINWCPSCKIGLANEEVVDGKCERCGGPTEKREKEQWMLAITKYADRLDKDLDDVDYLEKIKIQQRNWIGRSEGAEIGFKIHDAKSKNELGEIKVFTTRPDTLFGCTYCVLAPEHPLVEILKDNIENGDEAVRYIVQSRKKTEMERTADGKEKTGVELKGVKAINPANNEEVPVFIADYVLAHYGTGAIMAVPAHDDRDLQFAKKYKLPVVSVIQPTTGNLQENPEKRKSIVAIVRNKKGELLSLNWGKHGGNLFIGGGREGDENVVACATREIAEETGYVNLRFVAQTMTIHHQYFAHSKKVARSIDAIGLLFDLVDEKHQDAMLEKDEEGKFTMEWLAPEIAEERVKDELHHTCFLLLALGHAYTGNGILENSGKFSGMTSIEGKKSITDFVGGRVATTYKLRDWIFSRQRYWGEPIPIIHCEKCGTVPVPEKDLPVTLPDVEKYEPTDIGESPLATMKDWVNTKCPSCGGRAMRETDTMPNWAGSSWYFLRYCDPHNDKEFASMEKLKYWMTTRPVRNSEGSQRLISNGVDWYNGGMEHTTLHLLYSRFWHKFLYDIGVVPTHEPYAKRTSHGMILAEGGVKMSKSKGNAVSPDDIVARYGADTLRVYEMFMGPFDQSVAWSEESIVGSRRFLERVWRLSSNLQKTTNNKRLEINLHKTIKKVGEDIEEMNFNTAISAMMIFVNAAEKEGIMKDQYEIFLKLLAPFAPHMTEELWYELGHSTSIHLEAFPVAHEDLMRDEEKMVVVQIDGKMRDTFTVTSSVGNEGIKEQALLRPMVKKWLERKQISRILVAKGKVVSIVTTE